ncbi:SEC14-like protein 1 like protein [Argiope bruennichi]|uniref:SEC14-like protein 1 like protein n=1 Tax=Argiope bruennichi TaxID=94029 RepID=A0A8T0EWB8_ARGBR|nr:SEC14-like protein 1 like protein [Argiope bruennichi]
MVQKYQSPVRIYKYPFELVMAAYEKRFPTCKMIPVFLGSDTTYEYNSEDGAVHIIERRCRLNVEAPYLLKKIIGVDVVYFIQKNTLDRRARTLKIEAYNESFANRIVINENCLYSGKEIIEYYINELEQEGVTYIPPFKDKEGVPAVEVTEESACGVSSSRNNSLTPGHSEGTSHLSPEAHQTAEANFKIESEYIKRCLGELTPFQESCLVQLKKWMADAHQGKVPSDQTLMRFLQAQDYNLEKAREMLCASLVWRKKYQVDRILSTYDPPHVIKQYFPGGWHHFDKDGRPVYILRLGQMDVKGFIKSIGEEGLMKLTLHVCEEGLKRVEEATRVTGKPTKLCEGGLVPKSFYMSVEDYEKEKAEGHHLFDDSMYHVISLVKGQFHEVVLSITDKGSVICWDFDVMKDDISFCVYRTKQPLPPPEKEQNEEELQGCGHPSLPLGMLTLETPVHSVIPKDWVMGKDYFVVEPMLTCKDGESVQGSHVTRIEGTYILQWKHVDTVHHHSFDFPLSSHKSKVMYYHEVLKSQDYRGSMSSLQSSHSGTTCASTGEQSGISSCPSR